ncbi:21456_t:CDS:2, partial [Rhizophagus irregularis]
MDKGGRKFEKSQKHHKIKKSKSVHRWRNLMASRSSQKSAAIAAGTCCFRGRYLLDLQQVPAEFAAGICWIYGRYLLELRQVPARFAA